MSPPDRFEPWLREKLAAEVSAVSEGDFAPVKAERLRGLRWALVQLLDVLEGRAKGPMIFGAVISADRAPALRGLEPEVKGLLNGVETGMVELIAAVLGAEPADQPPVREVKGFWGKAKALFAAPEVVTSHVTIGRVSTDLAAAKSIIEQSPENVVLRLLSDARASVRAAGARWLIRGTSFQRPLEDLVERETELEVALAAATTLGEMGSRKALPALLAIVQRATTPELRANVITTLANLSSTEAERYAQSSEVTDRLAVVRALQRAPLIISLFRDADERVVLAAIAAAEPEHNRPSVPAVLALARSGVTTPIRRAALKALEPLTQREPGLILDLLLELTAREGDPLRAQAYEALAITARYRGFGAAELKRLREAHPGLDPESDAAKAIHRVLERDQPTIRASSSAFTSLEEQIDANPDDEQAWLVFADTLQSQGDVRGELIALSHANQPILQRVTENAEALIGPVCALFDGGHGSVLERATWKHGFLDVATAHLDYDELDIVTMPQLVAAIVTSPLARFISELKVGLTTLESEANGYEEVLSVLDRTQLAHRLRGLTLGEFEYPEEMEISWAPWGDISALWSLMPRLEKLHLRGAGGDLGSDIFAPELRALTIETGGLGGQTIESVLAMRAPKLRRVELWLGSVDYGSGCTESHLEALLGRTDLPALETLALKNSEIIDGALPLLSKSPLVKQLKRLDFSMSILGDEAIDALEQARESLEHLESLDLSENNFSDQGVERLAKLFPRTYLAEQRGPDERYVPVGE